jgi:hypothetical protein
MRRLPDRPELPAPTTKRLQVKTDSIDEQPTQELKCATARNSFQSCRGTQWFANVLTALRGMAGRGELCMYCSANEPSQVEHYRPISTFPALAFVYTNYLWTCDICNRRYKGTRFPPDTEPGSRLLNPIDDNVWDFFFIDETLGLLVPKVDPATNDLHERALSTRDIVGLNREQLQVRRNDRFNALRERAIQLVQELTAGEADADGARARVKIWIEEPFQADVADYFLRGPGRSKEPFRALFVALGETIP